MALILRTRETFALARECCLAHTAAYFSRRSLKADAPAQGWRVIEGGDGACIAYCPSHRGEAPAGWVAGLVPRGPNGRKAVFA